MRTPEWCITNVNYFHECLCQQESKFKQVYQQWKFEVWRANWANLTLQSPIQAGVKSDFEQDWVFTVGLDRILAPSL